MKHPTTSFEISLKDLQNYTQNRLFYQSLLICFPVPEKRIIFASVQRRKRGKIRLSYHLSFKLLVVNWSNMLHRQIIKNKPGPTSDQKVSVSSLYRMDKESTERVLSILPAKMRDTSIASSGKKGIGAESG